MIEGNSANVWGREHVPSEKKKKKKSNQIFFCMSDLGITEKMDIKFFSLNDPSYYLTSLYFKYI